MKPARRRSSGGVGVHSALRYWPWGLVGLLLGIATVVGLFSGRVPTGGVALVHAPTATMPGATLHGLIAAVFVGAGILTYWYDGRRDTVPSLSDDRVPPERPRNAPDVVGERFDADVTEAIHDIRLHETPFAETAPRQELRALVHRAITIDRQRTDEDALRMVARGEWTSDPVAATFLGADREYPLRFRLLRWAEPATAYRQAVERTSHAAATFVEETAAGRGTLGPDRLAPRSDGPHRITNDPPDSSRSA